MHRRRSITIPGKGGACLLLLFAAITVEAQPPSPPVITKVFTPIFLPPLYPGLKATLRFHLSNPNAATSLNGVGFTDTLPTGLVVATPNNVSINCSGALSSTGFALPGSGSVSFTVTTPFTPGEFCDFAVDVLANGAAWRVDQHHQPSDFQ